MLRSSARRLLLAALGDGAQRSALPAGARFSLSALLNSLDAASDAACMPAMPPSAERPPTAFVQLRGWSTEAAAAQVPVQTLPDAAAELAATAVAPRQLQRARVFGAPSAATLAADENKRKHLEECAVYLVQQTGMTHEQADKVMASITMRGSVPYVRKEPQLVTLEDNVRPVVEFLASVPGCDLSRALRFSPFVLTHAPVATLRRNAAALSARMGLEGGQLGELISKACSVLLLDMEGHAFPMLDLLASLGISPRHVRGMLLRYPRFMLLRRERVLESLRWLPMLHLTEEDVPLIWYKFPAFVAYSGEQYKKAAQLFRAHGLFPAEVRALLRRFPHIVSFSQERMENMADFIANEMGLGPTGMAKVLRTTPDLLGRSIDRLRANVASLTEQQGFQRHDVVKQGLEGLGYTPQELPAVLATNPMYLSYRLDRIAERAAFLQAVERGSVLNSLTSWLSAADDIFCGPRFANCPLEEFRAFQQEWRSSPEGQQWVRLASPGRPNPRLPFWPPGTASASGLEGPVEQQPGQAGELEQQQAAEPQEEQSAPARQERSRRGGSLKSMST
eukprot:scaffold12.g7968.t1